jgi:hypothetical protein
MRAVGLKVAPREGRSPWVADAVLAELMRNGWLSPPTSVGEGPPPSIPVMSWEELKEELDRDREDR